MPAPSQRVTGGNLTERSQATAPAAIELIAIAALRPSPRNARTHSKARCVNCYSIKRFGFTNPVLIDRANMILAGHGRVAAAKQLGLASVPCRRIESMTASEKKRAYMLADNKLALNAGWDEEILAEELKGLLADDLEFDIGVTGFSIAEIDSLVDGLAPGEPGDPAEDLLPSDGAQHAVGSETFGSSGLIG